MNKIKRRQSTNLAKLKLSGGTSNRRITSKFLFVQLTQTVHTDMRDIDYSAVVKRKKRMEEGEGRGKRDTEEEESKALQTSVPPREMREWNHCWWPRQPAFPSHQPLLPVTTQLLMVLPACAGPGKAAGWLTECRTEAWPWGAAFLSLRPASLTACNPSVATWSWLGLWGDFVREKSEFLPWDTKTLSNTCAILMDLRDGKSHLTLV